MTRTCFSCGHACTGHIKSLRPVAFDWCGSASCRETIGLTITEHEAAAPAQRHAPECDVSFGEACSREPGCVVPPGVDAQPRPTTGDVEVWPLVLKDIEARQAFGMAKYGVPLRTNDGRKSLVDLYQELLDAVVYVRKEIEERGGQ